MARAAWRLFCGVRWFRRFPRRRENVATRYDLALRTSLVARMGNRSICLGAKQVRIRPSFGGLGTTWLGQQLSEREEEPDGIA